MVIHPPYASACVGSRKRSADRWQRNADYSLAGAWSRRAGVGVL